MLLVKIPKDWWDISINLIKVNMINVVSNHNSNMGYAILKNQIYGIETLNLAISFTYHYKQISNLFLNIFVYYLSVGTIIN